MALIHTATQVPEAPPPPDLTERVLRRFLGLCENPRTRRRMLALVRGSAGNARSGRRLYGVVNRIVLNPVARSMGMEASAIRMELAAAQLIGVATVRYVLEVEPVASMPVDDLVRHLAPTMRHAMAGPVG